MTLMTMRYINKMYLFVLSNQTWLKLSALCEW